MENKKKRVYKVKWKTKNRIKKLENINNSIETLIINPLFIKINGIYLSI